MTRSDHRTRRAQSLRASSGSQARAAVSASALAGGCLAVVALWKTAQSAASAAR